MARLDNLDYEVNGTITNYEIVPEIAPLFNATTAYAAGDTVIEEGHLYRFNTAHAAGAWIGTDADEITVGEELTSHGADITELKADLTAIAEYGATVVQTKLSASDFEQGAWSTNGTYSSASYRVRTKLSYHLNKGDTVSLSITSGYKAVVRAFDAELDGTTSHTQVATTDWQTTPSVTFTAQQECWAVVTMGNTSDSSLTVETAASNIDVYVPSVGKIHSEIRLDGIDEQIAEIETDIEALDDRFDEVPSLEVTMGNMFDYTSMVIGYDKAYDKTGTIEGATVNLLDLQNYTAIKIPLTGSPENVSLMMAGLAKLWGWYAVTEDMTITSAYGSRLNPTPSLSDGYVCENIPPTAKYLCLSILYYEEYESQGNFLMVCSGNTPTDYRPYVSPWYQINGLKSDVIPAVQDQIDANTSHRQWVGKTWSQYGDSVSTYADFPSAPDGGWATIPNNYHKFSQSIMRGIGGQSFAYGTHGGSVAFINADGSLNSVNQNTNYDDYSGTVPSGTTKSRGAFCSWLRITLMYPASIKDDVDLVVVMGGTNDSANDTAPTWIENSTVDAEWASSDYYSDYGGDYNIETLQGGVASTIMKMHAWMPNAQIIIATPINGRTDVTGEKKPGTIPTEYVKSNQIISSARMFGANVIDVFGGCGINVVNSDEYISDGVHPNSAGRKQLGCFFAGELNRVYPTD